MPLLNEVLIPRAVSYTLFDFVLIALASLYLAQVITSKEGPFYLFRRLRDTTRRKLGGLFDCIWCVVFWVALGLFLAHAVAPAVTWVFALCGAAMVLRSYSGVMHG